MKKASLIPVPDKPIDPAPRGETKPIERLSPTKPHRPSVERFFSNIDKDLLEFFLDQDQKYELFIRALHDTAQAHLSYTSLLKRYGITLVEIQAAYADGKRHMGLINMANKIDRVMDDIGEDALSRMESCSRCDGIGQVLQGQNEIRQCPVCKGAKEVKVRGDKDSRQQMLEAMKILGKGGPAVVVNQQFGSGSLEEELQVTQKIVMGDRT